MKYPVFLAMSALGLAVQGAAPSLAAKDVVLPWGQLADQAGWETFVQVTAPAGIPGSADVEFETWASDEDIYITSPPKWPVGAPVKKLHPSLLNAAVASRNLKSGLSPSVIAPGQCGTPQNPDAGKFPNGACIGEEVRRNWASFQYITNNKLYTKSGLAKAAQSGLVVNLPADAVEVKGDWVKLADLKAWLNTGITDADIKKMYHVNVVQEAKGKTEYALVAFHFSTKQIKSWIWVDFEHELNPGRCDDIGCHDAFGAQTKDVPPKNSRAQDGSDVNGNQSYGACVKSDAVEAMMTNAGIGGEWRHYCLKATQIDFVNADGTPTIVGNSVIERIAADVPVPTSSCITCHAFAAFGADGSRQGVPAGPLGKFDPASIGGKTQNDFIWGIALPLHP